MQGCQMYYIALWRIFQRKFRREKTLLSDIYNNEILIINLATARRERNSIYPKYYELQNVVRHQ